MRINEFLERQSSRWIFWAGLLATALIGVLDYYLPSAITLAAFYLAAVLFVGWYGGGRPALVLAFISIGVWWATRTRPEELSITAWRAANRCVSLVVVAFGGAAMRTQRTAMRERIAFLEERRELEEQIVRAGEIQQMRIGQDLHDGLCQQLAAIDCAVACLKDDVQEHLPAEMETTNFIHAQLKSVISEVRRIARGLFPVQVSEEGFIAALYELVDSTRRACRRDIELQAPAEIYLGNQSVGLHFYRIAQEAVSNAIKHSQATKILVGLSQTAEALTLSIHDNGVGLGSEPTNGMGLRTMKYRADAIGGSFKVERVAGKGTMVSCTVPLEFALRPPAKKKTAEETGAVAGPPAVG